MIGVRTLLEDTINVHYLMSKTDETERMAVATDWFRVTNDPEAYKNNLDGKNVKQRAEAANEDTEALYNSEYAIFCNYTHSTAMMGIINIPEHRALGAKKAIVASLKAYANILTCMAEIVDEEVPNDLVASVNDYLDKYRETVTTATLPISVGEELSNAS